MRQIVLFVSVLVLFLVCFVNGAEPNFVRTTIFGVDWNAHDPHNVVSTDYSDGLGRSIQSKLLLYSGQARVVSSFFDDAGRPYLTTKPYIDKTTNPVGLFTPGDFNEINAIIDNFDSYYSTIKNTDPSAYAYSELQYYDDPLGRVKRAGAPGIDYRLGSGHFTSSWTFGVTTEMVSTPIPISFSIDISGTPTPVTVTLNGGFIRTFTPTSPAGIEIDILDGFYEHLLSNPITGSDHFLTVTKDPDGKLTQVITDLFGRTDSTRSVNGMQEIIAKYKYDILGNVLIEEAPNKADGSTLISDSKYEYNTLGQLIRKESPDLFVESMTYDNAGNIESKIVHGINGKCNDFDITYRYDYDDMSRLKVVRVPYYKTESVVLVNYFYDNTEEFFATARAYGIPTEYFENLENTQGKLVAEIAYNRPAGNRFYFGRHTPKLVVDVYSYDGDGRIKTKFKVIPGLQLQTINYTYDNHGKMETEEFISGSTTSMKYYKYDADGNLKAIAHNNENNDIVTYLNDPHGWLKSKDYSKLTGDKTVSYTYNIRDWMKSSIFNGVNGFKQELDYIGVSSPSYNGNIKKSTLTYTQGAKTVKYNQDYSYDAVNRLDNVETKNFSDNSPVPGFENAKYQYDNAGRFTSKHEGSSNNNDYQYYKDGTNATCRLKQAKTGGKIYIYDYKGNMIIDQSKNMYISYDWRNLPIKFDFYNSLPVGPDNTSKISPDPYGTMTINDNEYTNNESTNYIDYIDWLRENGEITLLSSVQMYYDASGKRVLKVEGK
jgi:YD repeat-containing protein